MFRENINVFNADFFFFWPKYLKLLVLLRGQTFVSFLKHTKTMPVLCFRLNCRQESIILTDVSRYLKPLALPWLPYSPPPLSFDLFSHSVHLISIYQPTAKRTKQCPLLPQYLFSQIILVVSSSHILIYYTSCLGLYSSFSF